MPNGFPKGAEMKNIFAKVAVAACFLVPVMAMAESESVTTNSHSTSTYFYLDTDADFTNLNLPKKGSPFDVTVNASWTDMLASYKGVTESYDAFSLVWTLAKRDGTVLTTGTLTDGLVDREDITLKNLASGKYTLTLTGTWKETLAGKEDYYRIKDGSVDLSSRYSVVSSPVTVVPEPESFAMMLAGLGLMGTIALRRKSADAS